MAVRRLLAVIGSFLSGALLGYYAGFWGPVFVGFLLGDDPIHQGSYSRWIDALMIILPTLSATIMAILVWKGCWPLGLKILRWVALAAGGWFFLLELI